MKVVMPFKDRSNYLRVTLASFKEACRGRSDIELHMFNDCSLEPLPAIIGEISNIKMHTRSKAVGSQQSKSQAVTETFNMFPDEKFILSIDSDCILHPEVFSVVQKMVEDLPDMSIGTVFNTTSHKFDKNKIIKSRYVQKNVVGGLGCVIKRDAWMWYQESRKKGGEKHNGWDFDIAYWLETQTKWHIYSTFQSYIEHFGQSGAHSGPECPIDKAFRFLN